MSYQTFKNLIALYFYNNSNNVAILLPQRAFKRRKAFIFGLFCGCEIIPTRNRKTDIKQFCFSVVAQIDLLCLRLSYLHR